MADNKNNVPSVPYRDKIADAAGFMSASLASFFRAIYDRLMPLGVEISYDLPLAGGVVKGLLFDHSNENAVFIDFIVQRVYAGFPGTVKVEAGTLFAWFVPVDNEWKISKVSSSSPGASSSTFSIDNDGQISLALTTLGGVARVNKITWRARTLKARLPGNVGV